MFFQNREQAGTALARKLSSFRGSKNTLVLAIPRGGVPVAREIAKKLRLPLGVLVTKKIGAPGQEELALGAVGPEGFVVLDEELIERLGIEKNLLEKQIKRAKLKVKKYVSKFKGKKQGLKGKTVILVDDGIATGATVAVAIKYLKTKSPKKVVVAIPVAAEESVEKIQNLADEVVVLETPEFFKAVGQFYRYFPQVTDNEVVQLLKT